MDASDLLDITLKIENKGSQMGHTKKTLTIHNYLCPAR
jgi:hypothetical protein